MTLTPEQFNQIALKVDLDRVEAKIDDLQADSRRMLDTMDFVVKEIRDLRHEGASNVAAHDRIEKRLTRAEQALKLAPLFDY